MNSFHRQANVANIDAMTARVIVLILWFIATALPSNAAQPTLETIRIAIPGKLVDFSPFFVGIKTGIYRSEGLEPQFIVMRSGIVIPALLSSELDYTTLYGSTIRSAVSGLPLKIIATLITKQSFFLFTQKDIRRVQDLKGKRIAVSNFASSTDAAARAALKPSGLEALRDVTLIAMGDTGVRYQALLSGAIEAAILTPPYTVMAEQRGLNNLVWLGDILGDVPSNGLSTTVKKLKDNPDQVQRMLRASIRSMIYTREHKQEALAILQKEFPGMEKNTLAGTLDFYLKAMSPDGRVSESVVLELIREQRELMNVRAEVPLSQVADFGPLNRVVKELTASK
ncbi:MAG: ABC transporter substrate-binding protein [Deltaproteobacteria bacterium]|nr:ABC transporter substrate-binding protein [Deltaproteobacteria bacterium]